MTDRSRRWALILSSLAVLALVVLAAGLSGLELLPGRPLFGRLRTPGEPGSALPTVDGQIVDTLMLLLGVLTLLAIPAAIFYILSVASSRKRLLCLLSMLLWLLALVAVLGLSWAIWFLHSRGN